MMHIKKNGQRYVQITSWTADEKALQSILKMMIAPVIIEENEEEQSAIFLNVESLMEE